MYVLKKVRLNVFMEAALKPLWNGCSARTMMNQSIENFDVRVNCSNTTSVPTGLIIGLYSDEGDFNGSSAQFTVSGKKFNDSVKGIVRNQLLRALPLPKLGQVRLFYGVDDRFNAVAVVGLGTSCVGYNPVEEIDEQKEVIRTAAALGARALQDLQIYRIMVESFGHAESAAEGAAMGLWVYQEHRAENHHLVAPKLTLFDSDDWIGWQIGQQKATAQNLARQFGETPANLMMPSAFAQSSVDVLTKAGVNVEVKVQNWAKLRGFNAFLSVGSGSCQPPIFLEAFYEGCDPDVSPVVLIGSGVTFDAGGVCLHRGSDMHGDLAGAASVVAALRAISTLQLPINVRGLIPLCENLPGASAYKPGDIITTQNGKTILVQSTANEGRLILADALSYSAVYNPKFVVDIGSLAIEVKELLGASAAGVFSNNDSLYNLLRIASLHTGDRVWRLPLWDHFTEDVTHTEKADVQNAGSTEFGGAGYAAAFLKEFLPSQTDWVHIDTYGIVKADRQSPPYLRIGMSGRPTRTIIEFLSQLGCRN